MVTHFTICFEGRIVWGPETKQMRALFFKADKECDFLDHFSPFAKVVHKAGCCFSPLGRKFCCDSNSDAVPPRSSSAAVSSTLELDRSCCHAYHTQLKCVLVVARKSTRSDYPEWHIWTKRFFDCAYPRQLGDLQQGTWGFSLSLSNNGWFVASLAASYSHSVDGNPEKAA